MKKKLKTSLANLRQQMRETRDACIEAHKVTIPTQCNHDINDANTSITRLPMRGLTFPPHVSGVCKCCKASFEYEVIDNELKLIESLPAEEKSAEELAEEA